MIIDDDFEENSKGGRKRAPSILSSKTLSSNISARSTKSALGYSPIPQDLLQQNKTYVTKWMNFYLFNCNLHSFPESVIE